MSFVYLNRKLTTDICKNYYLKLVCLYSVCPTVKHSLIYFITTSSGLQSFPELVIVGTVDGVTVGSCNSDINTIEGRQDWSKKLNKDDRQHLEWRVHYCKVIQQSTKADIESIKQQFHQSGGMTIFVLTNVLLFLSLISTLVDMKVHLNST